MKLYPFPYNLFFTPALQYMGVFRVDGTDSGDASNASGNAAAA